MSNGHEHLAEKPWFSSTHYTRAKDLGADNPFSILYIVLLGARMVGNGKAQEEGSQTWNPYHDNSHKHLWDRGRVEKFQPN